jgi:hypothetical protein
MSSDSKYNVGQYGFKPWMANITMAILEIVMIGVWLYNAFFSGVKAASSLDESKVESWDQNSTFALIACIVVWNLLVWFIKPLKTKYNMKETWFNLLWIGYLIYTIM